MNSSENAPINASSRSNAVDITAGQPQFTSAGTDLTTDDPYDMEQANAAAETVVSRARSDEERKAAYQRWLNTRSREDLIDLVMKVNSQKPAERESEDDTDEISSGSKVLPYELTSKVMRPARPEMPREMVSNEGELPKDFSFTHLPASRSIKNTDVASSWYFILFDLDHHNKPLALHIDDEITVGRSVRNIAPDLDLTAFGAKMKGVSRLHAWIRPGPRSLIMIDNDSSNGTFRNRVRIEPNTAQEIGEGDVITFGRVEFLLRIVKAPDTNHVSTVL